jgi:hypothetical protein
MAIPLGSNDDAGRDLPCSCATAPGRVFDLGPLAARALTARFPPPWTEKGAARAPSLPNEMISDGAPKCENGEPEESEKQCGPRDLRNFGIITSYDRDEKASEYGKCRKCGGEKIEKFC